MKTKKNNRYFIVFCCILISLIIIQYSRLENEETADITSPATYQKGTLSFSYPGNWKITEDIEEGFSHHVAIESPGNAIFIIQIFPALDAIPLQQFAEQFSELTQQKGLPRISNRVFSEVKESINSINNYSIQENFSLKVSGGQAPHIRRYYSVINDEKTAYLISQAATEDLPKVDEGFSLTLKTFFMKD